MELFENTNTINYHKGETLCKQDAIVNQLIYIEKGYAKVYIEHKGKNIILRILRSGDIIGLHNLFYNQQYAYSATAIAPCTVKSVSFTKLHEQMQDDPRLSHTIIARLNMYTSGYFNNFISLTQKQLHGRLADAIIHLAEDVYQSNEFELHLSRKDIAEFTGMATESAIRIIKEFHNDKIIELQGKNLRIVSMKLLKKLSDLG